MTRNRDKHLSTFKSCTKKNTHTHMSIIGLHKNNGTKTSYSYSYNLIGKINEIISNIYTYNRGRLKLFVREMGLIT